MLTWTEMEHENGFIGFDDDRPRYFVHEDEDGWYCEDRYGFGYGGLDTADQAMADAEEDCRAHDFEIDWEDLEPLDLEDLEEAYWDAVAHERMEITKGLC